MMIYHWIFYSFQPGWGGDMFGKWGYDEESYKKSLPFDIPMQGLGVFLSKPKLVRF